MLARHLDLRVTKLVGVDIDHWTSDNYVENWRRTLAATDLLVATPQLVLDILNRGVIPGVEYFDIMVFDEAHHCKGKHPYFCIMDFYHRSKARNSAANAISTIATNTAPNTTSSNRNRSTRFKQSTTLPRIFGMSAAPAGGGASKFHRLSKSLAALQASLDAQVVTVADRTALEAVVPQAQLQIERYLPELPIMREIPGVKELERGICHAIARLDIAMALEKAKWTAGLVSSMGIVEDSYSADYITFEPGAPRFKISRLKDVLRSVLHVLGQIGPWGAAKSTLEAIKWLNLGAPDVRAKMGGGGGNGLGGGGFWDSSDRRWTHQCPFKDSDYAKRVGYKNNANEGFFERHRAQDALPREFLASGCIKKEGGSGSDSDSDEEGEIEADPLGFDDYDTSLPVLLSVGGGKGHAYEDVGLLLRAEAMEQGVAWGEVGSLPLAAGLSTVEVLRAFVASFSAKSASNINRHLWRLVEELQQSAVAGLLLGTGPIAVMDGLIRCIRPEDLEESVVTIKEKIIRTPAKKAERDVLFEEEGKGEHDFHADFAGLRFGFPLLSPKAATLLDVLQQYRSLSETQFHWSAMVFAQQRLTVSTLSELMSVYPACKEWLNVSPFMAQGPSFGGYAWHPEDQHRILDRFRAGELNLLVSTAVAEEGIDVKSCQLIIRFDPAPTAQSFHQSRGRARALGSTLIALVEEGNDDEEASVRRLMEYQEHMRRAALDNVAYLANRGEGMVDDDDEEDKEDEKNIEAMIAKQRERFMRMNVDDENSEAVAAQTVAVDGEYIIESTGARVTLQSAVNLLQYYVSKLPGDEFIMLRPVWRFDFFAIVGEGEDEKERPVSDESEALLDFGGLQLGQTGGGGGGCGAGAGAGDGFGDAEVVDTTTFDTSTFAFALAAPGESNKKRKKGNGKGKEYRVRATVRLPSSCSVRVVTGNTAPTKTLAKAYTALEACRQLHVVGALNDHLLPAALVGAGEGGEGEDGARHNDKNKENIEQFFPSNETELEGTGITVKQKRAEGKRLDTIELQHCTPQGLSTSFPLAFPNDNDPGELMTVHWYGWKNTDTHEWLPLGLITPESISQASLMIECGHAMGSSLPASALPPGISKAFYDSRKNKMSLWGSAVLLGEMQLTNEQMRRLIGTSAALEEAAKSPGLGLLRPRGDEEEEEEGEGRKERGNEMDRPREYRCVWAPLRCRPQSSDNSDSSDSDEDVDDDEEGRNKTKKKKNGLTARVPKADVDWVVVEKIELFLRLSRENLNVLELIRQQSSEDEAARVLDDAVLCTLYNKVLYRYDDISPDMRLTSEFPMDEEEGGVEEKGAKGSSKSYGSKRQPLAPGSTFGDYYRHRWKVEGLRDDQPLLLASHFARQNGVGGKGTSSGTKSRNRSKRHAGVKEEGGVSEGEEVDGVGAEEEQFQAPPPPLSWILSQANKEEGNGSGSERDSKQGRERDDIFGDARREVLSQELKDQEQRGLLSVYLVPELCGLHPVPCSLWPALGIIPILLWELEGDLHAVELVADFVTAGLDPAVVPPVRLIRQAITATSSMDSVGDYEMLEALGDSFLKFTVCTELFLKHPSWHEGQLTATKDRCVSNRRLLQVALRWGLEKRVRLLSSTYFRRLTAAMEPHSKVKKEKRDKEEGELGGDDEDDEGVEVKKEEDNDTNNNNSNTITSTRNAKILSDCVESLIGAFLAHGGTSAAFRILQFFELADLPWEAIAEEAKQGGKDFTPFMDIRPVEEILGHTFRYPWLAQEALTHGTVAGQKCYQRLEYLGDAVLDIVLIGKTFAHRYDLTPARMHDIRSIVLNYERLALCTVRAGLHCHLAHHSVALFAQMDAYVAQCELILSRIQDQETQRVMHAAPYHHHAPQYGTAPLHRLPVISTAEAWDHVLLRWPFGLDTMCAPKVMCDLLESLIGAIFLDTDGDLDVTWRCVERMLAPLPWIYHGVPIPAHPLRRIHEVAAKTGCVLEFRVMNGKIPGGGALGLVADGTGDKDEDKEEGKKLDVFEMPIDLNSTKFNIVYNVSVGVFCGGVFLGQGPPAQKKISAIRLAAQLVLTKNKVRDILRVVREGLKKRREGVPMEGVKQEGGEEKKEEEEGEKQEEGGEGEVEGEAAMET